MVGKIDGNGYLWIGRGRSQVMKAQYCEGELRCGDHCPLFGEIVNNTVTERYEIEICHKVLDFAVILDERNLVCLNEGTEGIRLEDSNVGQNS